MRLDLKQLKQLSVETESGQKLGKIYDVVFELEGQIIAQYLVRSLLHTKDYLISRDQVVRSEEKRIVVTDSVAKESVLSVEDPPPIRASVEPLTMRTEK